MKNRFEKLTNLSLEKNDNIAHTFDTNLVKYRRKMIVVGVTGSMGSGKSSLTYRAKRLAKVPVWDADLEVKNLYTCPAILKKIAHAFPDCMSRSSLDRSRLRHLIAEKPEELEKLENILYPALAVSRQQFLSKNQRLRTPLVLLDIPLLFEKNLDILCDFVVLVRCPDWLIHQRILRRPGMTFSFMQSILSRQLSQNNKATRADFIIDSGIGHHHTWSQFQKLMESLVS